MKKNAMLKHYLTMDSPTRMSNKAFSHIVLMGRQGIDGVPETLLSLKNYLTTLNAQIAIEKSSAVMLGDQKLPIVTHDDLPAETDLIIVVGGDGSMLNAAHIALGYDLPVLGINRGRLGFLTDIHPNELIKIGDVLNGHYQEEKRFLLKATLSHQEQTIDETIALNDVVLLPGDSAHMIEFATYIDGQFVCNQRADGLIIASPTGSTAYSLSGGGPILHPQLNAVVLVSMFPHTLSSRPIVVSAESRIEILISATNDSSPHVSCDGLERVTIPPGGKLTVRKEAKSFRLIHPNDYNYYTTLREKLGWEKPALRMQHE